MLPVLLHEMYSDPMRIPVELAVIVLAATPLKAIPPDEITAVVFMVSTTDLPDSESPLLKRTAVEL